MSIRSMPRQDINLLKPYLTKLDEEKLARLLETLQTLDTDEDDRLAALGRI